MAGVGRPAWAARRGGTASSGAAAEEEQPPTAAARRTVAARLRAAAAAAQMEGAARWVGVWRGRRGRERAGEAMRQEATRRGGAARQAGARQAGARQAGASQAGARQAAAALLGAGEAWHPHRLGQAGRMGEFPASRQGHPSRPGRANQASAPRRPDTTSRLWGLKRKKRSISVGSYYVPNPNRGGKQTPRLPAFWLVAPGPSRLALQLVCVCVCACVTRCGGVCSAARSPLLGSLRRSESRLHCQHSLANRRRHNRRSCRCSRRLCRRRCRRRCRGRLISHLAGSVLVTTPTLARCQRRPAGATGAPPLQTPPAHICRISQRVLPRWPTPRTSSPTSAI